MQARDTLVTSYKQLRAGDVTGGAVYRITVRQLEALIRLSEAHARVRCSDVIEPRDVREVSFLLAASQLAHALCSANIISSVILHRTPTLVADPVRCSLPPPCHAYIPLAQPIANIKLSTNKHQERCCLSRYRCSTIYCDMWLLRHAG